MTKKPAASFATRQPRPRQAPVEPLKPSGPQAAGKAATVKKSKEIGGPSGPEPTRYGDWERKGICVDF